MNHLRKDFCIPLKVVLGSVAMSLCVMLSACNQDKPTVAPFQPPEHKQQDTTGNEIEWSYYVFGPGQPSSSAFKDVIAFSDTDVWVGGLIYSEDSASSSTKPYAVYHWDGAEWNRYRVPLKRPTSNNVYHGMVYTMGGGQDKMMFVDQVGEGSTWNQGVFTPTSFKYRSTDVDGIPTDDICWVSDNEIYFAGQYGNSVSVMKNGQIKKLLHVDKAPFKSVVSDGKGNVWVSGFTYYTHESAFYWITLDGVPHNIEKQIWYNNIRCYAPLSLWNSKDSLYGYLPGVGLYVQALYDTSHFRIIPTRISNVEAGYVPAIAGYADNDVIMGGYSCIVHYNGKSLRYYNEIVQQLGDYVLYSAATTREKVYLVGATADSRGLIIVGKKLYR